MTSDILYLNAITLGFWSIVLVMLTFGIEHFTEVSDDIHKRFRAWEKEKRREELREMTEAGDYWDGEELDYDTGEIITNSRPSVRHPKNRDRAYSGSAERFHDGGW